MIWSRSIRRWSPSGAVSRGSPIRRSMTPCKRYSSRSRAGSTTIDREKMAEAFAPGCGRSLATRSSTPSVATHAFHWPKEAVPLGKPLSKCPKSWMTAMTRSVSSLRSCCTEDWRKSRVNLSPRHGRHFGALRSTFKRSQRSLPSSIFQPLPSDNIAPASSAA